MGDKGSGGEAKEWQDEMFTATQLKHRSEKTENTESH